MKYHIFYVSLALTIACAGCANVVHDQAMRASAAPHPLSENKLNVTPIVTTREGGMYRIVTADDKELCVNGEVSGTPEGIQSSSFVLRSLKTPNDDVDRAPKAKSGEVKLLGTNVNKTMFQTCFQSDGVFTRDTEYLVIERERSPLFGPADVGVWHFDDSIK